MCIQRVIKSLVSLGLSQADANVYIYLATNGPTEAEKVGEALKLKEKLVCQSLKKLRNKGVVSSFFKQSELFSALPFEETLELLVKNRLEEAESIELEKNEIISKGKTIT